MDDALLSGYTELKEPLIKKLEDKEYVILASGLDSFPTESMDNTECIVRAYFTLAFAFDPLPSNDFSFFLLQLHIGLPKDFN